MLNRKHFEILKELKKEDDLSRIAKIFNQTERNIRYKIKELNENMGEEKIFIKKRKIYSLLSAKDIDKLVKKVTENIYVYDQRERIKLLILTTLLECDEFDLIKESERLQISKSTLRADLKVMRENLSKMGIQMKQVKSNKYRFNYKNTDLIYYLAVFIYDYLIFDSEKNVFTFKKSNYFERIMEETLSKEYEKIINDVYKKIKTIKLDYTDETIDLLILLIAVLITRKIDDYELEVMNKKVLKETVEFKMLRDCFKDLSEIHIIFLADYLIRISCEEKEIFTRHKNWLAIELGVYRLVKEFEKLKQVELLKNQKLINDILYYIKPLIYRSSRGIELKNSVLKEVKSVYRDTFFYLKQAFAGFEKIVGLEIPENEIGFLVPIFEIALKNQVKKSKKVMVVSSYKRNLLTFLASQLEEEFYLDIVKVISMKNFDESETDDIDLLITTGELSHKNIKCDLCKINPILTEKDRNEIMKHGIEKREKKINVNSIVNVIEKTIELSPEKATVLKERLVQNFPAIIIEDKEIVEKNDKIIENYKIEEVDMFSWRDVVKYGAQKLYDAGSVNKKFLKDIVSSKEQENFIFFLNKETALFYTEPKYEFKKADFSIVCNKNPLLVLDRNIKYFVCFVATGSSEDQRLIFKLDDYFEKKK